MQAKPRKDESLPDEAKETAKRTWTDPSLEKLPRLTDLTLQTGDPVPGDEGVF
ncbi:MAG: hypothetical protein ABR527_00510 [Gemmatimonadota bacterium]